MDLIKKNPAKTIIAHKVEYFKKQTLIFY